MQRIMVMGPPGSGKSTLARALGARHGLPVFHLDQAYWWAGWIEASPDEFQAEVARIASLPRWVIDGNYSETFAPRLARAECIVYLDVPPWVALPRILRRIVAGYGRVRADAAPGCPEQLDLVFLRFVWSWNRIRRQRSLAMVAGFAGEKIVIRTRAERERLLA